MFLLFGSYWKKISFEIKSAETLEKKQVLTQITFGESIAELESQKLQDYFIETEYWTNVRNGKTDVIYGPKGSGKSAIYTSIVNDASHLFDERVLIASAENPSGSTAFSSLTTDPPTSFTEFVRLWKLYFLVIASQVLKEYDITKGKAKKILQILEDCELIPIHNKLSSFIRACLDFIRRIPKANEVSTTTEIDPMTGCFKGQKFSIAFSEPSSEEHKRGIVSVDQVYELLTETLSVHAITLWIVIDRLDVAFVENDELETNALKALFKTYLDLKPFENIKLKIFLRDDIWKKINEGGFREASHITKYQNINWNRDGLLNLIITRLLDNEYLVKAYNLDKESILSKIMLQEETFYRFFPSQVDSGIRKPKTIDWILGRTRDGKGNNAPREIIQLLNHAKEIQIKRIEHGNEELSDEYLISRTALKEAAEVVSRQRIEQTLYAEYPKLKEFIEMLRNDKAEQTMETLALKWGLGESQAREKIGQLVEIGFFERKGSAPNIKYKIPFIYRPYLGITQGAAMYDDDY